MERLVSAAVEDMVRRGYLKKDYKHTEEGKALAKELVDKLRDLRIRVTPVEIYRMFAQTGRVADMGDQVDAAFNRLALTAQLEKSSGGRQAITTMAEAVWLYMAAAALGRKPKDAAASVGLADTTIARRCTAGFLSALGIPDDMRMSIINLRCQSIALMLCCMFDQMDWDHSMKCAVSRGRVFGLENDKGPIRMDGLVMSTLGNVLPSSSTVVRLMNAPALEGDESTAFTWVAEGADGALRMLYRLVAQVVGEVKFDPVMALEKSKSKHPDKTITMEMVEAAYKANKYDRSIPPTTVVVSADTLFAYEAVGRALAVVVTNGQTHADAVAARKEIMASIDAEAAAASARRGGPGGAAAAAAGGAGT